MKKILKYILLAFGVVGLFSSGLLVSHKDSGIKEVEIVEAAAPNYSGYRYKFEVPGDFEHLWLMAWGASQSSDNFSDWYDLPDYSYNADSNKIYTFCTNVYYSGMVLTRYRDNVDYCKSADISIGQHYNATWKWDGVSGHTATATYPSGATYYLYDYTNMFGGNAKCYAWQSCGSISNANYPGVDMNKAMYGSGQLYFINLDNIFDMAIFGIGDTANTGDQWINQNRTHCFCWWEAGNGEWKSDMDWVRAHDWVYQTMHVRDILSDNNNDTGACRGEEGYYAKAKEAYEYFPTSIRTIIANDACFDIASARFTAWAKANGEDAHISGTTLTVSSSALFANNVYEDKNSYLIIIIVAVLSISSIGVLLVIKRRRLAK